MPLLVLLGFAVGVLGGFFGIGGAFMVTPTLNILGFPMAYAIGTDLAHVMGKSIIATLRHREFGNVDLKLGLFMIPGTVLGLEAGKDVILYLEEVGAVETYVRLIYILLLAAVGVYMIYDCLRSRKHEGRRGIPRERGGIRLSMMRFTKAPPMISLPRSGIKAISVWTVFFVAFGTGFLAGLLGVGGGFIRVPALIYLLGVPTLVAIGTDLFEIIFSAGTGAFLYALEGKVDIIAAAVMLLGASVGAQLGATATKYVKAESIRFYFAATLLSASISVLLKQVSDTYVIPELEQCATYLILGASAAMCLVIVLGLLRHCFRMNLRREVSSSSHEPQSPLTAGRNPHRPWKTALDLEFLRFFTHFDSGHFPIVKLNALQILFSRLLGPRRNLVA